MLVEQLGLLLSDDFFPPGAFLPKPAYHRCYDLYTELIPAPTHGVLEQISDP